MAAGGSCFLLFLLVVWSVAGLIYIHIYERILFAVVGCCRGGAGGLSFYLWALVGPVPRALPGPFPWALVGPFPTEGSEACSERIDEIRDCSLHITLTKDCT